MAGGTKDDVRGVASDTRSAADRQLAEWGAKYPPLLAIGIVALLAVALLPSSLTIPRANPTSTLEFAPVPASTRQQEHFAPDVSSLSGAASATVDGADTTDGTERGDALTSLATPPPGTGLDPTNYRCVGSPPRQTEDPLSPPCVAYFDADNGGATYRGVTAREIRLLLYIDTRSYSNSSDRRNATSPAGTYHDLLEPSASDEFFLLRGFRAWQRYFNDRFQTYGRRVRFVVYFSRCAASCSPEQRRGEAAENFSRIKPFAVMTDAVAGFEREYLYSMAKRGVLNFGSFFARPSSFFSAFPKLIWGYQPSIEQQLDLYTTYVCTKAVGHPSVLAGPNPGNGRERRLGMLFTSDPSQPGLISIGEAAKARVEACGGTFAAPDARYPRCCMAQDNRDRGTYARDQMAQFKAAGVTTILWTGGIVDQYGRAAQAIGYEPEWIVLGDGILDANNPPRLAQLSTAWDGHAITVTPQVFEPALEQQLCYRAFREADDGMPAPDVRYLCGYYRSLFQFFVGVQVAGPRLGPTSIDKGFHAIPARPSGDPQTPACFYKPNDYTCVKDATAEVWDATTFPPGDNRPGCWEPLEGGKRYLPGTWPEGNIDGQRTGNETCNAYDGTVNFYPYPV